MIFYFSGTGNSQLVAQEIADVTNDELISIHQYLKLNQSGNFESNKPWVFVTPTYAWRMPRVVEHWIQDASFNHQTNAYFVLTCAGSTGNAIKYIKKICKEKKWNFKGLTEIIMPENYLAMFPTPSASECQVILEKAKPSILATAQQILKGESFKNISPSFRGRLSSGPVHSLYYTLLVHDRGFKVSNQCVSCKKCAQRCPLNNIEMKNGKPIWKGNCTHCMACIGGCPTKAIDYKSKTKDRYHYYIKKD